ncbi:hypothetical protein [Halobacillus sp. Nhm2S1]|uniref:hypothetical protein n=1 Tax=Halobacillus sp. Nhm2S1 TaxID=2866716 RepID=UPI001C731591|nr:hypothetical protein [Halobacillus sp. Nhm2S1]MBX0356087.1 hypothetical protein [Halobacillus sp. Nhm2S1]
MKNRNTDDYRHHRERIIRKHIDILLYVRQYEESEPGHPWLKHPGKLAKAHRKGAYRYEKKHKIRKAPEKSRLQMMLAEMEQYEEDWC